MPPVQRIAYAPSLAGAMWLDRPYKPKLLRLPMIDTRMPQHLTLRDLLARLADTLGQSEDDDYVAVVTKALSGPEESLIAFLTSNEMWGGSGSIADQAGLTLGRKDSRRRIEQALIELGAEQIRVGHVHIRTGSWVDTFKDWQERGL